MGCKYFLISVALIRTMLFKVVISENVVQFGDGTFHELLGDLFIIKRLLTDPLNNGWKINRKKDNM